MRKGHYSTEAIILNSFDYGESDRILAFYTKEFGKLRGIAKGARRSKRRFVGNICPPSYVNLLFSRGNGELAIVEEASLLGMAGRMPAEKLSRLITDEAFMKESEAVLSDFIRHQTGRELKTKKIIERLGM